MCSEEQLWAFTGLPELPQSNDKENLETLTGNIISQDDAAAMSANNAIEYVPPPFASVFTSFEHLERDPPRESTSRACMNNPRLDADACAFAITGEHLGTTDSYFDPTSALDIADISCELQLGYARNGSGNDHGVGGDSAAEPSRFLNASFDRQHTPWAPVRPEADDAATAMAGFSSSMHGLLRAGLDGDRGDVLMHAAPPTAAARADVELGREVPMCSPTDREGVVGCLCCCV